MYITEPYFYIVNDGQTLKMYVTVYEFYKADIFKVSLNPVVATIREKH